MSTTTSPKIRHNPPKGWDEDRRTGLLRCPHRDLSVCPVCADTTPECCESMAGHYWMPTEEDRAEFFAIMDEVAAEHRPHLTLVK